MYYSVDQVKQLLSKPSPCYTSITHLNIRSLSKHYDDVRNFQSLLSHNFSIICLSETWLSPCEDTLFTLPNYHCEFDHRPNDRHGGSAIFISHALPYKRRVDLSFRTDKVESVWLEFDRTSFSVNKNTIVASIYRSPSSSYPDFCAELENILHRLNLENKNIIIVGDINVDISDINDASCSEYISSFQGHGLDSLIVSPTRCMPLGPCTLIDHVLSNLISSQISGVINFNITDHYPIFLLVENQNPTKPKILHKTSFNSDQFIETIATTNWGEITREENVDKAYDMLSEKLKTAITSCTSRSETYKRYTAPRNPWITRSLLQSIRKRDNLHKKVKLRPFNLALKARLKKYSHILTKLLKEAKQSYYQNQILKNGKNNYKNWKLIKEFLNLANPEPSINEVTDGTRGFTTPTDIADAFNAFFSSSVATQGADDVHLSRCLQSFFLRPTAPEEVYLVLCSLKNTGAGLDSIAPSKIKLVARELSGVLASLVNKIFKSGVFPTKLKQGKIVPVFKKGERYLLSNYRPITILPFFSKLIEKLIVDRLMSYLNKFEMLTSKQFGFRPNYSTEQALITFTDAIKSLIDKGHWAGALFIDFTKAFDTINHNILFSKLESFGISGPALNLLRSYLTNRTQVVQIKDSLSQPTSINRGVPQGSLLGPLLFLLYINDLPDCLSYTNCILYADDTTLFIGDENLSNVTERLNNDLKNISLWCQKNQLHINPTKTNFLIFHSHQKQIGLTPSVSLDNHNIVASKSAVFLGITLDPNLKFNLHAKTITKKMCFGIRVLLRSRFYFPVHILRLLYFAFVHSHISYCISSWGNTYQTHLSRIQHLQNQAIRLISFNTYTAPTYHIYKSLGILQLRRVLLLKLGLVIYRIRSHIIVIDGFSDTQLTNSNTTRFSERHNLLLPKARTNYGKQTALFSGITFWNTIPVEIKLSRSLCCFHSRLKRFFFESYSDCGT